MHSFSSIDPIELAKLNELARITQENLLQQLSLILLQPKICVDLGCGIGDGTAALKKIFPAATLFGVDEREGFLQYAKENLKDQCETLSIQTPRLPFQNKSVDIVYSNLFLPWLDNWEDLLKEVKRILKPEGLFIFSCLGIDTLKEIEPKKIIIPSLIDMHVVGDLLTQHKFVDPVLDTEHYEFSYRSVEQLNTELQAIGMISEPVLEKSNVTFEIVYGHAFGPTLEADQVADSDGVIRIPVETVKNLNKKSLL